MTSSELLYVRATNTEEIAHLEQLGFTKQHVVAQLRQNIPLAASNDVKVRKATSSDIPELIKLEREFEDHMRSPEINAIFDSETDDEMREGFEEQLSNPEFITLVAELNDEIVGMAYACSTSYSSLHSGERRPPNSATFAKAVVTENHRRKGIGRSLTSETVHQLRLMGFETIVSDWRILNTEANEAWSKLGFEPTWYRMVNE